MMKAERQSKIVELVNEFDNITTEQLTTKLNISEATIRRDLNELDAKGLLSKVFGGARSNNATNYITVETPMDSKKNMMTDSKEIIGKFAASLIEDNDFVYLDSGSTVQYILPFIKSKNITIVTNSIEILNSNFVNNLDIYVVPGKLKPITKSVIGAHALEFLNKCIFTKGFFGTNGIHSKFGFTTPNNNEAIIKENAMQRCKEKYILADSTKFGIVSKVVFSNDDNTKIITEQNNKAKTIYLKEVR